MTVRALTLAAALTVASVTAEAGAEHAVVLQYHHVAEGTPAITSVTPDLFAAHLDRLARDGFHVASLPDVIDALRRGEQIPDSTVCLTADDGYASLREHALPLLRERGWPMTVFVCPAQVDRGRPLHLGWDDLRALRDAGWTIASHGLAHEHLVARRAGEDEAAWRARVRDDLARSLERLREELGDAPDLFAYPYGEYDAAVQDVVRELGLVGFGQHSGPIGAGADFTALPRFPVSGPYGEPDDVAFKAATLPLPVTDASPSSPVLSYGVTRPELTLTIAPDGWSPDGLAAYASGQGRLDVTWIDREAGRLSVRAPSPLPAGRSRYNVTAPGRDGGRWYWFSQPWLRPVGNWRDE